MAHKLQYDPDSDVIVIYHSGDVSLDEIFSSSEEAWQLAESNNCTRFLSVFLDANFSLTADQVLEVHKHLGEIGVSKDIRLAVLIPTSGALNLEVQIFEFAAGTDGWRVAMFYNRDEALDWLSS